MKLSDEMRLRMKMRRSFIKMDRHLVSLVISIFLTLCCCQAQAQATTDPSEVKALKSIFEQWQLSAVLLLNVEPCAGAATDTTDIENFAFNPGIKCNCAFNNSTTCHITQLRVYALNVRGIIPEELASLTFLTYLKLDQNYLTGPLPAFLGNLSALQILSVGINALSGTIPKDLGQLKMLRVLGMGSNNFSGPLPKELGSIVNLEQIYIDSAGVNGEIPSTFANLVNMQTMWASDNAFTGKIPDFIGNWTKLTSLRFQGNSFEGPIPPVFSNLSSLNDLRISDLSNVSSSLGFMKGMKNLTNLVLRNNLISGGIPSDIGEFIKLERLDLSFNNLSGQIPGSLFNLSSLSYLFLGNNSLSGTLPRQKISKLLTVDLSYNLLSGDLPSWVSQQNLQLNLVSNNLTFGSSDNSVLASGLNCLQRNFACNRGSPRYANIAIKCGGAQKTSSDGTVFESENSTLGPASYYVTNARKWAISYVGLFAERSVYYQNTSSLTAGTVDPELFLTARISAGSLRYYGLGLENGPYNVSLQFAEIAIDNENSETWQSLGRRVFDIYLQGNLEIKDFNIKKEAGGASNYVVRKDFKVRVSQNFLEIHLFWAGKGTCCIPFQGAYGPLISTIKITPGFKPTDSTKNHTGLIVGITVSIGLASLIAVMAIFYLRKKRSRRNEEEVLLGIETRPNTFPYAELRTATRDFNPDNKLGEGGFGPVYKGMLPDGREVAVKKLSVSSHQGKAQFVAEITTISAVQHRNLVKLYGCCIDGDNRLLVYEYLINKSLDQAVFGKSGLHLDWANRYDICLGTARGLAYLHEESRPRIVHRDVKASNILIDTDLTPKISDFGLAKLYDDKKTHISTRVAGTIGYLAPEYAMRGHLTEKADVFGYGVVALEVLSGRPNSDKDLEPGKIYLLEWAWTLYESNRGLELVDPTLTDFNEGEALRLLGIALLCTQASPMLRPPMSRVVAMLSGDIEVSAVMSKPSYLSDWQYTDMSTFMSDETKATTSSQLDTSSNSNTMFGEDQSPILVSQPMLHQSIGEGR